MRIAVETTGAGASAIALKNSSSHLSPTLGLFLIFACSPMAIADTPPATSPDPCKTQPCFKANNGQSAHAADLKSEPRDLTLQYPGEDLTAISPKDAVSAAGRMADATQQVAEKTAGPLAGAAAEMVGKAAAVVTTTYDVTSGAITGYQNGGGVPGAVAGAAKAVVVAGVGLGTTLAVTAACTPVLGPAAPAVGVLAGACAEDATRDYLDHATPQPPRDASYNCAKIGICADSDVHATGSDQDPQAEIDSIVAEQTQRFDSQWTSAMSNRLDQLQAQLAGLQAQQGVRDTASTSWIESAAALAVVAAGSRSLSALTCAESLMAGNANSQCLNYSQTVGAAKQPVAAPGGGRCATREQCMQSPNPADLRAWDAQHPPPARSPQPACILGPGDNYCTAK